MHGVGERTVLAIAHGMHEDCDEYEAKHLMKFAPFHMTHMRKNVSTDPSGAPLSKSKLAIIYKELEASHFPTRSGVYNASARRGGWHCQPVRPTDPPPPMRALEVKIALKAIRALASTRVLETFDDDLRDGATLHATYAKVPSKSKPVDCLHWTLPGVPDVWTEKCVVCAETETLGLSSQRPFIHALDSPPQDAAHPGHLECRTRQQSQRGMRHSSHASLHVTLFTYNATPK